MKSQNLWDAAAPWRAQSTLHCQGRQDSAGEGHRHHGGVQGWPLCRPELTDRAKNKGGPPKTRGTWERLVSKVLWGVGGRPKYPSRKAGGVAERSLPWVGEVVGETQQHRRDHTRSSSFRQKTYTGPRGIPRYSRNC